MSESKHGHDHGSAARNFNTIFLVGIGLNITYVVLEGLAGWKYNSLSLISDAGHNLSDVGSLLLAWFAFSLLKKKSSYRHTYGFAKATILSALTNGVLLMVAIGALLYESIDRLIAGTPEQTNSVSIMAVAGVGIFVNGITAYLFMKDQKSDLNIRGAYLHMAADTAVSAGVVLAGAAIFFTGAQWIDPLMSVLICAVIGISSLRLLKSSLHLTMGGVPEHINAKEVESYLRHQAGVTNIHDLHIWALSTAQIALTVHIVRDVAQIDDQFLARISHDLKEKFCISHSTIQLENSITHATDLFCKSDPT